MDLSKAERLAALLDGNCTERERQELLEELAAGGDDLEVFADAAAVLYDPEPVGTEAGVGPPRRTDRESNGRQRWRPPRGTWLVAPALALALAALLLWPRPSGPARRVAELAHPRLAAPPDWMRTRGNKPCAELERRQCAVLIGGRLVALETAVRVAPDQAPAIAGDIAAMLPSPDVAREYRQIQENGVTPGEIGPKLTERAETVSGYPDAVRLGEWIEAARSASGDTEFFRKPESRKVLRGAEPYAALLQPAAAELAALNHALATSPTDWTAVQAALDELLRHLAG